MTDNLFDRLAELLQSDGPVNWRLAREIAESVAGSAEPIEPWVAEECEELGRTASLLVAEASPLDTASVPPLRVLDRRGWATANVTGFGHLAEPMAERLAPEAASSPFEAVLGPLGPALIGIQTGSVVGAMARTTLGQFDAPLPPAPGVGSFLVVPNLEGFAADHGLDARQVRLWAAVRETAHQAVGGLAWFGPHLAATMAEYVATLEMRPEQLQERLEALQDPARLEEVLAEPGALSGLTPGPGHSETLGALQALLATLEGYGDWLVGRAAADLLPDATQIRSLAATRHREAGPAEQALEQAMGLRLERSLGERGSEFCAEVAGRWGEEALDRIWEGPDTVPTRAELDDALGWAARVLLT